MRPATGSRTCGVTAVPMPLRRTANCGAMSGTATSDNRHGSRLWMSSLSKSVNNTVVSCMSGSNAQVKPMRSAASRSPFRIRDGRGFFCSAEKSIRTWTNSLFALACSVNRVPMGIGVMGVATIGLSRIRM